jgi:GNAT superfamily N-acetyltransferase
MPLSRAPAVEPLGRHHDRAAFSCGEKALDEYLQRQATQDVRRRISQVFVAVGDAPESIAGYYSLSAASFSREALPEEMARRLPRYPVTAAILGRLAVDRSWQRKGLGEFLLADAAGRVLEASKVLGVFALIVDAKNDRAVAFYERYGFKPFPASPGRLFVPLETVARARG